jgi:hypothetical protein
VKTPIMTDVKASTPLPSRPMTRWDLLLQNKQAYVPGISASQAAQVFAALTMMGDKKDVLYILTSSPPKRVLDAQSQSDPIMQFVLTLFVNQSNRVATYTVLLHLRAKNSIAWQRLGDTVVPNDKSTDRPSFETIEDLLMATNPPPPNCSFRAVSIEDVRRTKLGLDVYLVPKPEPAAWIQGIPTLAKHQPKEHPFRLVPMDSNANKVPRDRLAPFVDIVNDFVLDVSQPIRRSAIVRYDSQIDGWMCWLENGDLGSWFAYPSLHVLIGRAPDAAWLLSEPMSPQALKSSSKPPSIVEHNNVQASVSYLNNGRGGVQLQSIHDQQLLEEMRRLTTELRPPLPEFPWKRTYSSIEEAQKLYFDFVVHPPDKTGNETAVEEAKLSSSAFPELDLMNVHEKKLIYGFHPRQTLIAWARLPIVDNSSNNGNISRYETFPLAVVKVPHLGFRRLDLANADVWLFPFASTLADLEAAFMSSAQSRIIKP